MHFRSKRRPFVRVGRAIGRHLSAIVAYTTMGTRERADRRTERQGAHDYPQGLRLAQRTLLHCHASSLLFGPVPQPIIKRPCIL